MPLTLTSSRKLAEVTGIPSWLRVRLTSTLFTVLSPLTSPISMFALTSVSGNTLFDESVTRELYRNHLHISHSHQRNSPPKNNQRYKAAEAGRADSSLWHRSPYATKNINLRSGNYAWLVKI